MENLRREDQFGQNREWFPLSLMRIGPLRVQWRPGSWWPSRGSVRLRVERNSIGHFLPRYTSVSQHHKCRGIHLEKNFIVIQVVSFWMIMTREIAVVELTYHNRRYPRQWPWIWRRQGKSPHSPWGLHPYWIFIKLEKSLRSDIHCKYSHILQKVIHLVILPTIRSPVALLAVRGVRRVCGGSSRRNNQSLWGRSSRSIFSTSHHFQNLLTITSCDTFSIISIISHDRARCTPPFTCHREEIEYHSWCLEKLSRDVHILRYQKYSTAKSWPSSMNRVLLVIWIPCCTSKIFFN